MARETKVEWIERHSDYTGDDCIDWPFANCPHGRGIVQTKGVAFSAPNFMCRAAHGNPPTPKHHAAHSCGNGHNGCLNPNHLRWATPRENESDKILHGTLRKGTDINTNKLSEDQVIEIRNSKLKGIELAKIYDVTPVAISAIRTRKNWAWLEPAA
jgi:hypothetical protein